MNYLSSIRLENSRRFSLHPQDSNSSSEASQDGRASRQNRGKLHQEFLEAFSFVLAYSIDKSYQEVLADTDPRYRSHDSKMAELKNLLDIHFLDDLYLEREERGEIQRCIPTTLPILVTGLPGVGKTVLLRKLAHDANDFTKGRIHYFDLKRLELKLRKRGDGDICDGFLLELYDRLATAYLQGDRILEFQLHLIVEDDSYRGFRNQVANYCLGSGKHYPKNHEEWKMMLSDKYVLKLAGEVKTPPQLSSLLSYVIESEPVLCLDNVDTRVLTCSGVVFFVYYPYRPLSIRRLEWQAALVAGANIPLETVRFAA